jgi:hypothetical protein
VAYGLDVLLALNGAIAARQVFVLWAVRIGTVLTAEIVFKIDHVATHMRYGSTADDAELRTALIAVLESCGVQHIVQRTDALVERLNVRARIISEAVHCVFFASGKGARRVMTEREVVCILATNIIRAYALKGLQCPI